MVNREERPKEPAYDINKVVQANIEKILAGRSPEAYCAEKNRALYYVTGQKKGKKVSARALRYAISGEQSPRLDMIAAIAAKEHIPPHILLMPHEQPPEARRWADYFPSRPNGTQ